MQYPLGSNSNRNRGASALTYGLVIGLISVVALTSVTTVGGSVDSLFTDVGETVGGAVVAASPDAPVDPNSECAASTWSQTSPGNYTYIVPANCFRIEVTVIGGGGAGGGWSSGTGNSGTGSSFGNSTVEAGGGQGGFTDNGGSGLGGTGGTGTYPGGEGGEGASSADNGVTTHQDIMGKDGATGGGGGGATSAYNSSLQSWSGGTATQPYGGNGATGYDYWNSGTGATATGCGGGGGADHRSGGGGGGGYSVAILDVTPGQSFPVVVGSGGSGYTATHGNYYGGAGANGCVYVDYPTL